MANRRSKYKAFISYSHADERWARWLQRRLERFRVPAKLRQQKSDLPARLYPIFRDRDELASSGDLSEAIQTAMAASEALIVVCSPSAAASHWANEEIRLFRKLHPNRSILCLLVGGSPNVDADDCAFPPNLLIDENGQALPEPLAADVAADGKQDALIKIAAGLLGVGVDDLKQRDAHRRARIWSGVAAGSTAVALLTIGLAIFAFMAQQESELRRGQAEGLIGFMLGDLREKLEPVGRLDLLDSVGDEAMNYFATLNNQGTEAEVLARALALRQIGEVRFNQAQLAPALEAFAESRDVAAALHAAHSDNNDYLFELSQAEFWVGYVAWERDQLIQAATAFRNYQQHSLELSRRSPDNADYQLELMYAYSNQGSVARESGQPDQALDQFEASIDIAREFAHQQPDVAGNWSELASGLSWRGSTLVDLGELELAQQTFVAAIDAQSRAFSLTDTPADRRSLAELRLQLAGVLMHRGQVSQVLGELELALQDYRRLVEHDNQNGRWQREFARTYLRLAEAAQSRKKWKQADEYLTVARRIHSQQIEDDPTYTDYRWDLVTVERVQAENHWQRGDHNAAIRLARNTLAEVKTLLASSGNDGKKSFQLEAVMAAEAMGRYLAGAGIVQEAKNIWHEALANLPGEADCDLLQAAVRASLAAQLAMDDQVNRLTDRLRAAGFRDPRFPWPVIL